MDADEAVRGLAARQHGVVARRQLLGMGVPAYAIDNRVRNGRLEILHRGVYRTGPVRGRHEREMAAVLASGDGAVVSHRSAGALWELVAPPGRATAVDVSVPGRHPSPGVRVRVHRVAGLKADEAASVRGVPVTTPARTILDLAIALGGTALERTVSRAERKGLADADDLRALLKRYPGRAGTRPLRRILDHPGGAALTRSEAEALLLGLFRRARLPAPRTNVRIRGFEVDFLFRASRVVVEVDGYTFHSSRRMFESDRARDRALTTAGYRVLRVTLREITEEPEAVLAQVAQALVGGLRGAGEKT